MDGSSDIRCIDSPLACIFMSLGINVSECIYTASNKNKFKSKYSEEDSKMALT